MLDGLLASILIATSEVYGDDVMAQIARRLGFQERDLPCSHDDGHIRIAILSGGGVTWNGTPVAAANASEQIHNKRVDIDELCIYVEGPLSAESRSALHAVIDAASNNSIHMSRFTDPNFEKRVSPNFQTSQSTAKP